MAKIDLNLNVQGLNDAKAAEQTIADLEDDVARLQRQLNDIKQKGVQTVFDKVAKSLEGVDKGFKTLSKDITSVKSSMNSAITAMTKQINALAKASDTASIKTQALAKNYQQAGIAFGRVQEQLSDRQLSRLSKQIEKLGDGKINSREFVDNIRKISKVYAEEFNRLTSGATPIQDAKAQAVLKQSLVTEQNLAKTGAEKLAQEKEITAQKEIQTREMKKQQEARSSRDIAQAAKAESQERVQTIREEEYNKQVEAAEIQRQQKLEKNDRVRLELRRQMVAIAKGDYELEDAQAQKLQLAAKRLKDTAVNIQNFAATQGYKGTVGAEATSSLRTQQFYKQIMEYATSWKRVNSEEGKAADTLGRMISDAKSMQSTINRIHTAFGQMASTVSAIRGIGTEIRKTFTSILQSVSGIVSNLTSSAFSSSLEALKNMELAEIGFGNFYGESAVSGIMQNVKQEALLSPLSAAQLSSYVNQIAPLSKGNSQLALDAAMGVAKMIQYSGGEVSTEMEYVIKNLRDVIAKGKALTIDIRQFNRAMPALTKVLEEMGESELVQNGELVIDEENAPKLLEAFQRVNEYGDVATIFERTSETISGLMERMEEQIQLFVIDVGEFSGLTDLIKSTLHDFLEDTNGLLSNIRMQAQFIGRDFTSWLKTRDWERVRDIAKEVVSTLWNGLKESMEILRKALGGTDWRETLVNLASAISSFVKGIANSYSWLLGIINTLNKSGILGSGLVQGAMGIFGFLSGNAGTLITGGLRGFGTAMGTLNQLTFTLINSMEQHQAELLKSATTVATFDEALAIVSGSLSQVAKDILMVDEAIGGVLTVEQRRIVEEGLATGEVTRQTLAKQSETVAVKASEMAIQSETAARDYNTAAMKAESSSGGLLGAASTGTGTKLGSYLSKALKSLIVGSLVGSISSSLTQGVSQGLGADQYGAANAGNWVGSIGGFAAGGAVLGSVIPGLGTAVGAIGGAVVGAVKAALESSGILDQERQDELDAFKQEVNNGTYLKEMLNSIERGNDISSDEFDTIESALVEQMNQWAASTPSGTAQMLKDYLRQIEVNGRSIDTTVKEINKTNDERAQTLWEFIEKDDIEGGNDYAATLQDLGLSSYQIAAMIMQMSLSHGKNRDETIDYLLKWGQTNSTSGEDLTSEMIANMDETNKKATADKLEAAWIEIGMQSVQNLDMDESQKIELSQGLGAAMAKFLTSAFDEMTDSDWWYMNRFLSTAKVSNVADQLGYEMSPSTMNAFLYDKNREKYGVTTDNVKMWSSNYKGHGAEDENGNPLGSSTFLYDEDVIDKMTAGMTAQEKWQWLEDNIKEYGNSTKNVIDDWLESIKAKEDESNSIGQSQENTLWEIRDSVKIIANKQTSAQQEFEALKASLPQLQTQNKANGGIVYLASGGSPRGVDTIPAMLQPGEYVVRRSAVNKVGLSALNALNTGNMGYFARAMGRQNIYGDYNGARTWNNTSNDNRNYKRTHVTVNNYTRGARLNRYYSLANRI